MAQSIVTKTLSASDKNAETFAANINEHMQACNVYGTKHDTLSLKEYKIWLKKYDAKMFSNVYEGNRIWRDDHSVILSLGKMDIDTAKTFTEAQEKLVSLGKTSRENSYSGASKLIKSYLDNTGKFAPKKDKAPVNEGEGEGDEGDENVETSDKKDKRSAASIASNFMQIATEAQATTSEILAEFAKLVEAEYASNAPAKKKAA